jgi:LL-H family phage holin
MDSEILSQLILNLIGILGLIASYFIIAFLKKKVGLENLKNINQELTNNQELAKLVVLYIQKKFETADGETKFNEAYIALSEMLEKKGINLTETEIQVLIESSLKILKKQFGVTWKEEVVDKEV